MTEPNNTVSDHDWKRVPGEDTGYGYWKLMAKHPSLQNLRVTPLADAILAHAHALAYACKSPVVSSEHVLWAVLYTSEPTFKRPAMVALRKGLRKKLMRQTLLKDRPKACETSKDLESFLLVAKRKADSANSVMIGAEHLMMTLIEPDHACWYLIADFNRERAEMRPYLLSAGGVLCGVGLYLLGVALQWSEYGAVGQGLFLGATALACGALGYWLRLVRVSWP